MEFAAHARLLRFGIFSQNEIINLGALCFVIAAIAHR